MSFKARFSAKSVSAKSSFHCTIYSCHPIWYMRQHLLILGIKATSALVFWFFWQVPTIWRLWRTLGGAECWPLRPIAKSLKSVSRTDALLNQSCKVTKSPCPTSSASFWQGKKKKTSLKTSSNPSIYFVLVCRQTHGVGRPDRYKIRQPVFTPISVSRFSSNKN